jgi:hypothetical protein
VEAEAFKIKSALIAINGLVMISALLAGAWLHCVAQRRRHR